jgi:hypothetical protein
MVGMNVFDQRKGGSRQVFRILDFGFWICTGRRAVPAMGMTRQNSKRIKKNHAKAQRRKGKKCSES